MRRSPRRRTATLISCVALLLLPACFPDQVYPGYYEVDEDAAVDASPSDDDLGVDAAGEIEVGHGSGVAEAAAVVTTPLAGPCDLSGRWIVTLREVATAIGVQEASHTYLYFELTQTGDQVLVVKGLHCGEDVRPLSSAGANVDCPNAWPSMLVKQSDTGRQGTSRAAGSGCQVSFEKRYQLAALSAAYLDPSMPLPALSEQASSRAPGWEDWEQDGHPGYTSSVTGLAVGKVYLGVRKWTALGGAIGKSPTSFTLPLQWDSEQDLLGYDGPSLLTETTSATVDSNASLHLAQFARLGAAQAKGDDATVCAAIRSLAPKLTPLATN